MTKNARETTLTIAYLILGLAGTFLGGYLTYKGRVFHMPQPFVLFLTVGLSGTLIYASLRLKGMGYAIIMVVLMYLGQLAVLFRPPLRPGYFVSAAIFAVPVGAAFVVSAVLFQRLRQIPFGKFIMMGLLVGLGYLIMISAFLIQAHSPFALGLVWAQTFLGMKIGAGIGLGVELVDLLSTPSAKRVEEPLPPPPRPRGY